MRVIQFKQRAIDRKPKKVVKKDDEPSQAQQRIREMGWLMYITEGFVANLYHAKAVNAYTMSREQLGILHLAIREAEGLSRSIHNLMAEDVDVRGKEKLRQERRNEKLTALQPRKPPVRRIG